MKKNDCQRQKMDKKLSKKRRGFVENVKKIQLTTYSLNRSLMIPCVVACDSKHFHNLIFHLL